MRTIGKIFSGRSGRAPRMQGIFRIEKAPRAREKLSLTNENGYSILVTLVMDGRYGGIAQLARAYGSYPYGRRFKSTFRYHVGNGRFFRPFPIYKNVARWSSG